MKLLIQIPCFNEEKTLGVVLRELPKTLPGVKSIEVVVVDDGSTDNTVLVAKKYGATVLSHKKNQGLGFAFRTGLHYALKQKADVLVNTDADNQYPSKYIQKLIAPVLEGDTDLVIGNRRPWRVKHFSPSKRFFQYTGSSVVRRLTKTNVPDTVSGFRAYSREAMYNLNITTQFSYVLDSIMQLSKKGMKITSVPIKINPPTRKSRLFSNMFEHMFKSGVNILRVYAIYEPFKLFFKVAFLTAIPGIILALRFLFFFAQGDGSGHVQSLIFAAISLIAAILFFILGIIAELLKTNRMIMEEQFYKSKKQEYEKRTS